jgi:primosomal protein N' (replication factor Y)
MQTIQVALPIPLGKVFDYLLPAELEQADCPVGARVYVPFGSRKLVGVVYSKSLATSQTDKLKAVIEILDNKPIIEPAMLELLDRMSRYYHHPIGEILTQAIPPALRKGKPAAIKGKPRYSLTDKGHMLEAASLRSSKQKSLHAKLTQGPAYAAELPDIGKETIKRAMQQGWVAAENLPILLHADTNKAPPQLNAEQESVLKNIPVEAGFSTHLLYGITGSGKTEVYLRLIEQVAASGGQALVLVPEIGLTPQTVRRFTQRLMASIAVIHSNLSESERLDHYLAAFEGKADVVIGTRSALFSSMPRLRLIIIDEEHDAAYKQQDGCRFHARDMAIYRAHLLNIPIVLGSATPSMESLYHAMQGRYQLHKLTQRAKGSARPQFKMLDMKMQPVYSGICEKLFAMIQRTLDQNKQAMLFINRRGYSPVLMCHDCGWYAHCQRCDRHYTYHISPTYLHCHHCDSKKKVPIQCPECQSKQIIHVGQGTEKVEQVMQQRFPEARIARIDRDSTRRKGAFAELLPKIHQGEFDILIGTQMLAKGHHFPHLQLVAILDMDASLFSSDFRAPEQLAQLLNQVAGRAGREKDTGTVVLQTHHPEHPLLQLLLEQDYEKFYRHEIEERRQVGFPPLIFQCLIRAEGHHIEKVKECLEHLRTTAAKLPQSANRDERVQLLGPIPAPIGKRAGYFRYQLLLQCPTRASLHQCIQQLQQIKLKNLHQVKVVWDIDPLDML